MLLIYTPYITGRIQYTMQYVFEERLGIAYSITSNRQEYVSNPGSLKMSYAKENIGTGVFFQARDLLFENDIKKIKLHETLYKNTTVLFSHNNNSALCFDVFTAIFYLLSRYEEYLNDPRDKHGNYISRNSILYKLNVLDIPVIEQWVSLLKETLLNYFPELQFKDHKATFGLSFDIDVAYAYKSRSVIRIAGGIAKKICMLNFTETKNQLLTLLNRKKDMFDTYHYIFTSIKNKKPIFFFDMGAYGKFDKNPSFKNKKFRQLIKHISEKAITGVHPSYTSNTNKRLITAEKNKLEQITGKPVTASRQHYLKLKLPFTYNDLISNNITQDFTLGYPDNYGFRAGTCNSFLFFDLAKNKTTTLRLYPFAYMDVTLNNYLNLNTGEAKKIISKLIDATHAYKGIFIPLWHNSTLCDCNEWKGWRDVFEHTLNEIERKNLVNIF